MKTTKFSWKHNFNENKYFNENFIICNFLGNDRYWISTPETLLNILVYKLVWTECFIQHVSQTVLQKYHTFKA